MLEETFKNYCRQIFGENDDLKNENNIINYNNKVFRIHSSNGFTTEDVARMKKGPDYDYILLYSQKSASKSDHPGEWYFAESPEFMKISERKELNASKHWDTFETIKKVLSERGLIKNMSLTEIVNKNIQNYNQIIFTGAPGTGKTYSVRKAVEELCGKNENRMKFVQFHPSYDYSDFVEGLRPVQIGNSNNPTFVRLDGTFKKFCRNIVEEGLCKAFGKKNDEKLEELFKYAKSEELGNDAKEKLKLFNDEDTTYYFIVDEINRADLSKVFGELMFGLEESYRGIENRFDTQYMNLNTYEITEDGKAEEMKFDCFKKGFFIPKNLKFIGTMNDIDRSVESFDFALGRRFQWIDVKANAIMQDSLREMLPKLSDIAVKDLANKIINLNKELTNSGLGMTEAYHIGPAYFKDYNGDNLLEIYKQKIEPIIKEYTRGRDKKKVDDLLNACREALEIKIEEKQ